MGNRDCYIFMNEKNNKMWVNITLLFAAFLVLFAVVGTVEYTDDVYYSIPEITIQEIRTIVGSNASRSDIVKEYLSNKEDYEGVEAYGLSEISWIYTME